ncbi:tetratricopeptide repeat protein [Azoarcus olearius]|uniref:Conserved hypothetical secreted protein n=1 Tax=Azoarcus sp. (strain BH72) TaxID=418699 RepID=A1KAK9_AZOSB|nr:tetratricopeptide repeat protein [Azoarcus olearius]CAL95865.1 conserved hypothetical secreted protein [Azoarcus olearius]
MNPGFVRVTLLVAGLLAGMPAALAQNAMLDMGCGSLENGYGPFDYRTQRASLRVVETYHFGPKQENAMSNVGGDLDYTLRASPNHHRALMAMLKYANRTKKATPPGMQFTVECYLIRGETFRADDPMVKVLFGMYLVRAGRGKEAIQKLEAARELEHDNANVNYNLGLAYFDLREYDKALDSAHRAYAAGFPLPGLRDKLKRAGKWAEPSVKPSTARPAAGGANTTEPASPAVDAEPAAAPASAEAGKE